MEPMSRVMHLKDIEKKIKQIEEMIANEQDKKRKAKLEEEIEQLNDLKLFITDSTPAKA